MAMGSHGLVGKQSLYDHTHRVPFFWMGPGIKAGGRPRGNVYLMDTKRTLCDLVGFDYCGPEPHDGSTGKSFAAVLRGEQETVRSTVLGVLYMSTAMNRMEPGIRSLTHELDKHSRIKLIVYDWTNNPKNGIGSTAATQLFNLTSNPHEMLDRDMAMVVSNAEYEALLKLMRSLLESELKAAKDHWHIRKGSFSWDGSEEQRWQYRGGREKAP